MEMSYLGNTGLKISRLGIGLAEIGYQLTSENILEASSLLNTAIDNGINFLDTSTCYGVSEELIGKTVSSRRKEYILATKCGHSPKRKPFEKHPEDWLQSTVEQNINTSLNRLKTDYVDLLQIHSCSLEILEKGEIIETLQKIRDSGKARFIGYSGDNQAAEYAMSLGVFDTLQTSFNLVDQKARHNLFPKIEKNNSGLIIKRPIANASWRPVKRPIYGNDDNYIDYYLDRANAMIEMGPLLSEPPNPIEFAIGFVLSHNLVNTAIVGTRNNKHLLNNIALLEKGIELDNNLINEIYSRFDKLGNDWVQMM
ncbi:MAG: aldo/keto reductase [Chloroflexi bacterium]|nr:aldo/keto reductase [Chloroflexota bacterium]|tara:strand:+ start:284 stop:1216 length:933 start_codon:yes stop_codon:yes gene_type:complete